MKKTLVRTCDYDFYTMRLPLSVLRRRKRSVFVRRELEKRHPQFSEKCCADTKFSLKGGRVTAEVAVMDTLRLAEYRKLFPEKKLYLEDRPERVVFRRRHTNVGKAVAIGAAFCCLSIAFFWQRGMGEVSDEAAPEPVKAAAVLFPPEALLASILSGVVKKGGRVSALSWHGGACDFSVSGCHPEDIVPDTVCAVSYTHNEPRFELHLPVAYTNALTVGGESQFVPRLRRQLLENGLVILRENPGEHDAGVQLFCQHDSLSVALKICAEQAELNQWHEREIQIKSGENGCDIKVSFSSGAQFYDDLSPFQVIAHYASVFEPKRRDEKVVPRSRTAEIPSLAKDKIGEIKRIDGEVFAYYRLNDGRIVCEKAQ